MKKREQINKIKSFFNERGFKIDNNGDLFESGVIDSMGIIELIVFIEEQFDIKLDAIQMSANNFRTLDSICALIDDATE